MSLQKHTQRSRWIVRQTGKPEYRALNGRDAEARINSIGETLYSQQMSETEKILGIRTSHGIVEVTLFREPDA